MIDFDTLEEIERAPQVLHVLGLTAEIRRLHRLVLAERRLRMLECDVRATPEYSPIVAARAELRRAGGHP